MNLPETIRFCWSFFIVQQQIVRLLEVMAKSQGLAGIEPPWHSKCNGVFKEVKAPAYQWLPKLFVSLSE